MKRRSAATGRAITGVDRDSRRGRGSMCLDARVFRVMIGAVSNRQDSAARDRHPGLGERRRKMRFFRRGSLSLGARQGSTSSTRPRAFYLFVDDDAAEVYDYDMRNATRILRKRQEVPSGHDPPIMSRTALSRRRRTARKRPSPARPPTTRTRRHRAAIALRLRRLRLATPASFSAATGCRWSIAASSTPSPISAAAPTRAGAGISTASSRGRPIALIDFDGQRPRELIERVTRRQAHRRLGASAGGMLMGAVANRRPSFSRGSSRCAVRRCAEHHARPSRCR